MKKIPLNLVPFGSGIDAYAVGVGLAADDKWRVPSRMGLLVGLTPGSLLLAVLGVPVGHR